MRCANSEALVKHLDKIDRAEKEQEQLELEFYNAVVDLKSWAIKEDSLELLKDILREEFCL